MTSVSRTAQFAKVHKILKKHYKPVAPRGDRSVLEHLMFACCLEDAGYEAAEEAFAALEHTFFDWNEVRVTSLSELSEVMARLPDPRVAGNRIKRILHGIFEANYSFDLEDKRKKNLGPTVKWLEKLDGATQIHRRLPGPVGLGRPPDPHRLRHHGRPANPRPGDRQGRGRRRRARTGAGGVQVQGDRVRFPAASTRRGVYGQSVFAGRARHPAANRARRQGAVPATPAGPGHAEGAGGGAGQNFAGGKVGGGKGRARPRAQRPAAARKPAARARAAFRPRPKRCPGGRARRGDRQGLAGGRRAGAAASETPPGEKRPTAETAKKTSSSEGLSKRKPR